MICFSDNLRKIAILLLGKTQLHDCCNWWIKSHQVCENHIQAGKLTLDQDGNDVASEPHVCHQHLFWASTALLLSW